MGRRDGRTAIDSAQGQLGPLLNGIVNFETWMPVKALETPAAADFLTKYQERAKAAGTDVLAYFPVMAYADLQVLGDAIAATKSLKDDTLASYMHTATFDTVVGDIKFGKEGEWAEDRMLAAQFQNIKKQQRRRVPRPEHRGRRLPARPQDRRGHLSVRKRVGEISAAARQSAMLRRNKNHVTLAALERW